MRSSHTNGRKKRRRRGRNSLHNLTPTGTGISPWQRYGSQTSGRSWWSPSKSNWDWWSFIAGGQGNKRRLAERRTLQLQAGHQQGVPFCEGQVLRKGGRQARPPLSRIQGVSIVPESPAAILRVLPGIRHVSMILCNMKGRIFTRTWMANSSLKFVASTRTMTGASPRMNSLQKR